MAAGVRIDARCALDGHPAGLGRGGAVLGHDCDLEPSIFIWSLRRNVDPRSSQQKGTGAGAPAAAVPATAESGDATTTTTTTTTTDWSSAYGVDTSDAAEEKRCQRVGQNFGLPHRDFSYDEAHFPGPEGLPRVQRGSSDRRHRRQRLPLGDTKDLIPCTPSRTAVTARPATPPSRRASQSCAPVAAARPALRRGLGHAWRNVIHWGACGRRAPVPRIAIAATFKVRGSRAAPHRRRAARGLLGPFEATPAAAAAEEKEQQLLLLLLLRQRTRRCSRCRVALASSRKRC